MRGLVLWTAAILSGCGQDGRSVVPRPEDDQSDHGISIGVLRHAGTMGSRFVLGNAWLRNKRGSVVLTDASGQRITRHDGRQNSNLFGWSTCPVGDLDDDGWPEFAVGAPGVDRSSEPGVVHILSGADGAPLFDLRGKHPGDQFGYSLASSSGTAGELLLIGAPGRGERGSPPQYALLVDLESGREVCVARARRTVGTGPDRFGSAVCMVAAGPVIYAAVGSPYLESVFVVAVPTCEHTATVHEVGNAWLGTSISGYSVRKDDGSDLHGIAVGCRSEHPLGVVCYDLTGELLRTHKAPDHPVQNGFGTAVRQVSDIDGDGTGELLISSPGRMRHGTAVDPRSPRAVREASKGSVACFSSRTGAELYSVSPSEPLFFGVDVDLVGDEDDDGIADFIVACGYRSPISAVIVSGIDGSALRAIRFRDLW